jgi:PAS domain S-box-containing protein
MKLREGLTARKKRDATMHSFYSGTASVKPDLIYLTNFASELITIKSEDGVFDFLAVKLKELLPKTVILINKSDEEGNWLTLVKVLGIEHSLLYRLIRGMGYNPVGRKYRITDEFKFQYSKPKMHLYNGSFSQFTNNEIPEPVAMLLEQALKIRSIHTIGIADQGQFFGFIHFLSSSTGDKMNISLLESVIFLCYLSIARINSVKNLEEREKQYKLLAENVRDIIFTLDLNLNYTYISPSVKDLRGYEPAELIGKSISQSLSSNSYQFIQELFREELKKIERGEEGMVSEQLFEVELFRKDGRSLWTEVKASIVYDSGRKPIGILGVTRDITERKNTEKELLKKNIELHEAVAQKDKLFSIIAHDLKNPFGHILNFSSLLKDHYEHYSEDKRLQFIELINKSSQQIYLLLENLLDWSRGGKVEFFPQTIRLDKILTEVTDLLSHSAALKNIELQKRIPANTTLYADDFMLKTVLRNLIGNAIKFTPDHGQVYIEAVQEKNELVVSVIDNGIGMDYALSNSLFNLDLNISKPGTRGERGTGLGLLLCKEFIDRHGGKIWVKSAPGHGSIFSFSIPVIATD